MTQSTVITQVSVHADDLFAYLSEVSNLPEYLPTMTSATWGDGGHVVHTTAKLIDGSEVEGEAWFEVDGEGRSIEWGSQGNHDYRGGLTVTAHGDDLRGRDHHSHHARARRRRPCKQAAGRAPNDQGHR